MTTTTGHGLLTLSSEIKNNPINVDPIKGQNYDCHTIIVFIHSVLFSRKCDQKIEKFQVNYCTVVQCSILFESTFRHVICIYNGISRQYLLTNQSQLGCGVFTFLLKITLIISTLGIDVRSLCFLDRTVRMNFKTIFSTNFQFFTLYFF